MRPRTASCSCGQLRIEVQGEPLGVGSLPLPGLSASNGQCVCCASRLLRALQGVSMATDYIRVGDQGAKFKFRFCPACGTTVFHTDEGHEQSSVGVAVGASATEAFLHLGLRSMTVADILGFSCRLAQRRMRRTPPD
jgi:hypothetical protein